MQFTNTKKAGKDIKDGTVLVGKGLCLIGKGLFGVPVGLFKDVSVQHKLTKDAVEFYKASATKETVAEETETAEVGA